MPEPSPPLTLPNPSPSPWRCMKGDAGALSTGTENHWPLLRLGLELELGLGPALKIIGLSFDRGECRHNECQCRLCRHNECQCRLCRHIECRCRQYRHIECRCRQCRYCQCLECCSQRLGCVRGVRVRMGDRWERVKVACRFESFPSRSQNGVVACACKPCILPAALTIRAHTPCGSGMLLGLE